MVHYYQKLLKKVSRVIDMKKWLAGLGILGLSVLTLAACGNKSDSKASG